MRKHQKAPTQCLAQRCQRNRVFSSVPVKCRKMDLCLRLGFHGGSDRKESSHNAGDLASILGREAPWRREWQPTPVFLTGESHGQRSLVGYSPWGRKESNTTELLTLSLSFLFDVKHFKMCLNKKIETLKEKSFSKKPEDAAELTAFFISRD